MSRRWRPSLAFVLGGAMSGTLGMSLVGLVTLRYLGPEIGFQNAAIGLALIIAAVTAGLGWLLVRLLLRPIRGLEAYAAAQETGAPAAPLKHFGTAETHRTATRVVAMAEALRDREATIRAYTDHVTHELKTPVSAIRAAVELLEDNGSAEDRAALLAQIDGAREQIEAQLAGLRDAARARETRYVGVCNLSEAITTLAMAHPTLSIRIEGDAVAIPLSHDGLSLILGHLLCNAAENGATSITVHATNHTDGVELRITDDGTGISPGNATRIFEPFFTTRRDNGGTGMGLAIVQNILAAHRGTIRLDPAPSGTRFVIQFRRG